MNELRHVLTDPTIFDGYTILYDNNRMCINAMIVKEEIVDFFSVKTLRTTDSISIISAFILELHYHMAFTYLSPYNSTEIADLAMQLINQGYSLAGDLNLNANKTFKGLLTASHMTEPKRMDGDEDRITMAVQKDSYHYFRQEDYLPKISTFLIIIH